MSDSRVEETERLLLAAVREGGRWISGDQRVSEETAAWLLGIAPGSLANRRHAGTAPPSYRPAGKVTYRLRDLAEFIEESRKEGEEW